MVLNFDIETIKRIAVISHNDLDGVSCAIMLKKLVKKEIEFSKVRLLGDFSHLNRDINAIFEDENNLDNCNNYPISEKLFIISDLSLNNELIQILNERSKNGNVIIVVDHHKTSINAINNFDGIINFNLYIDSERPIIAATGLVYELLRMPDCMTTIVNEKRTNSLSLFQYQSLVNEWDTFIWKETSNYKANELNILFKAFSGPYDYLNHMVSVPHENDKEFNFTSTEKVLIENEIKCIDHYVSRCVINSTPFKFNNITFRVVCAEDYFANVGEYFTNNKEHYNEDVLLIVNLNGGFASLRRLRNDSIDLSLLAESFGGGGHPAAAGFTIRSNESSIDFNIKLLGNLNLI